MKDNNLKKICIEIGEILTKRGETLSTAESCTAGQIATAITGIPGSSAYYKGGIVCYSNEIKIKYLGVPTQILQEKGAVSKEVVTAMLHGVIKGMNTTYAIAVTGYAGPGGGEEAEVGTIWIACGNTDNNIIYQQQGDDGREENLKKATQTALQNLLKLIKMTDTSINM